MTMQKNYSKHLSFHLLVMLFTVVLVATVGDRLVLEGSSYTFEHLLLIFSILSLGHVAVSFQKHVSEMTLFALFMADAAAITVLARTSGSSQSPFLVLFPLLTVVSSVIFSTHLALIVLGTTIVFQFFSIGFGLALAGNILATGVITGLGLYLEKALNRSDVALKISEGARKRLENLQKAILANIPSGLLSVDSQGRVIQINEVGLRILGYREHEVLLKPLRDLIPTIEKEVAKLSTLNAVVTERDNYSGTERPSLSFQRRDGDTVRLGYSVVRLADPDDKSVLGSLVVFQDLTVIVRMEENLRLSQKLAAIGKLAAGIAHEIRNPLAGISGSAQLLEGSPQMDAEDKKLLAIIQRESTRLDSLITEFLEYVRPQKPKLEKIDLLALSSRVVDSLKVNTKWAKLNCEIRIQGPSQVAPVFGDENKIIQSLLNLVLNAGQAKATLVEIDVTERGSITVRDNGQGISPEHQLRLFEPFFTTKEGGTGLGLATTYRGLEAMNARIRVSSPLPNFAGQGGTAFTIDFITELKEAA